MQQVVAVARSAVGAVCVIGSDTRIRYCNADAERLLGLPATVLVGMACAELFGEENACLPVIRRALGGEPVEPFDLLLQRTDRQNVLLGAIPLAVKETSDGALVLSLFARRNEAAGPAVLGEPPLTARETEVLRYLVDGWDTDRIAATMAITRTTVRNHVQRLLRKLGAHSKLEAVAIATRLGLRGMSRS